MDFLHARDYLMSGDIVVVWCDTQCNVMVMDDTDFSSHQRGGSFHYHGGHYRMFPARIAVPSSGWWNTVLDLGGSSATIRHRITYIKRNG